VDQAKVEDKVWEALYSRFEGHRGKIFTSVGYKIFESRRVQKNFSSEASGHEEGQAVRAAAQEDC
tara:strand:- start:344 stop:538 length:195 start_codon:yes stop_codon:yes gene_type:complete